MILERRPSFVSVYTDLKYNPAVPTGLSPTLLLRQYIFQSTFTLKKLLAIQLENAGKGIANSLISEFGNRNLEIL
ncbi:MAG: hypothetical protein ACI81W_000272 [Saprospiraceae bacterium]|jgi:hypothetical protein